MAYIALFDSSIIRYYQTNPFRIHYYYYQLSSFLHQLKLNSNMFQAYHNIVNKGGFGALWSGTPSRTVEGALLGAFFILGSTAAKKQVLAMGGGNNLAALAGGTVGGVMQAVVMTPAGMIFTSLNVNQGKKGYENDNAITVAKRIIKEKGVKGLFYGGGPMCLRQASNWSSRSLFTEIARTNLKMSQYGIIGEVRYSFVTLRYVRSLCVFGMFYACVCV